MTVDFYFASSERMTAVEDESVALILTSPQEVQLYRDKQILIPSVFPNIFRECQRVLKPGGYFILNVGTPHAYEETIPKKYQTQYAWALTAYPYIMANIVHDVTILSLVADIIGVYTGDEGDAIVIKKGVRELQRPFQLGHAYEHFFVFSKGFQPFEHHDRANLFFMPPSRSVFDEGAIQGFIEHFSKLEDLVLDPFAGTGTLGKVASEMGRNVVLYEINPTFREAASKIPGVEIHEVKPKWL